MVAITLVAGAAVLGWVNGQANTSENVYGASANQGINYLREHFAPVTYTFSGCSGSPRTCSGANFWVFNNGQLVLSLASVQIKNATDGTPRNLVNIAYNSTGTKAGFTSYSDNAGKTRQCSLSVSNSVFSGPGLWGASAVPIGTLATSPYSVTVPTSTCSGVNTFQVGQNYVITMTGVFGNVVQLQVSANG
jgi:hypothetical protein